MVGSGGGVAELVVWLGDGVHQGVYRVKDDNWQGVSLVDPNLNGEGLSAPLLDSNDSNQTLVGLDTAMTTCRGHGSVWKRMDRTLPYALARSNQHTASDLCTISCWNYYAFSSSFSTTLDFNCTNSCSGFDNTPAYLLMSELLLLMLHALSLTLILHLVKCCKDQKWAVNLLICSNLHFHWFSSLPVHPPLLHHHCCCPASRPYTSWIVSPF